METKTLNFCAFLLFLMSLAYDHTDAVSSILGQYNWRAGKPYREVAAFAAFVFLGMVTFTNVAEIWRQSRMVKYIAPAVRHSIHDLSRGVAGASSSPRRTKRKRRRGPGLADGTPAGEEDVEFVQLSPPPPPPPPPADEEDPRGDVKVRLMYVVGPRAKKKDPAPLSPVKVVVAKRRRRRRPTDPDPESRGGEKPKGTEAEDEPTVVVATDDGLEGGEAGAVLGAVVGHGGGQEDGVVVPVLATAAPLGGAQGQGKEKGEEARAVPSPSKREMPQISPPIRRPSERRTPAPDVATEQGIPHDEPDYGKLASLARADLEARRQAQQEAEMRGTEATETMLQARSKKQGGPSLRPQLQVVRSRTANCQCRCHDCKCSCHGFVRQEPGEYPQPVGHDPTTPQSRQNHLTPAPPHQKQPARHKKAPPPPPPPLPPQQAGHDPQESSEQQQDLVEIKIKAPASQAKKPALIEQSRTPPKKLEQEPEKQQQEQQQFVKPPSSPPSPLSASPTPEEQAPKVEQRKSEQVEEEEELHIAPPVQEKGGEYMGLRKGGASSDLIPVPMVDSTGGEGAGKKEKLDTPEMPNLERKKAADLQKTKGSAAAKTKTRKPPSRLRLGKVVGTHVMAPAPVPGQFAAKANKKITSPKKEKREKRNPRIKRKINQKKNQKQ